MAWLSKTRNKVILVVTAVLFVAAVVGVVVGVMGHREAGLLTVCWGGMDGEARPGLGVVPGRLEGRARYLDDDVEGKNEAESCEGPTELAWPRDQIPITISTIATLGDDEPGVIAEDDPRHRVLDQAIRDLNSQVGFTLFRRIPSGTDNPSSWVHFGEGIEARQAGDAERSAPPGYVSHRILGDNLEGHVYIRSDVEASDRLLFRVLLHELLHLAGLAHDDFTASLMFPVTRDDTLEEMSTAHVTDFDRALLRRLYR
jgi:hypothetical protein